MEPAADLVYAALRRAFSSVARDAHFRLGFGNSTILQCGFRLGFNSTVARDAHFRLGLGNSTILQCGFRLRFNIIF